MKEKEMLVFEIEDRKKIIVIAEEIETYIEIIKTEDKKFITFNYCMLTKSLNDPKQYKDYFFIGIDKKEYCKIISILCEVTKVDYYNLFEDTIETNRTKNAIEYTCRIVDKLIKEGLII